MSTDAQSQLAKAAAEALASGRLVVMPEGSGAPVELPESVAHLVAEALEHVTKGEDVRVIADTHEISTQQAADILNVSRPYLVQLVDRGEIPSRKVGSRRRLKLSDVMLYREVDQARRLEAIDALAAEAQELGLY